MIFKPTEINFLNNNFTFPFNSTNNFFASFSNRSEFNTTAKKSGEIRKLGSINGIMTAFNKDFYFTLNELAKYLNLISVKKLLIMVVIPDKEYENKVNENRVQAKYYDGKIKIEVLVLSYSSFLRLFSYSSLVQVGESTVYNPTDILYLFNNISWSSLVYEMKERNNILITGGINAKRHLSSTLTARHMNYLLPFFGLNMKHLNNCIENSPSKEIYSVEPNHFKDLKLTKQEKYTIEQRKIDENNKWQALMKDSANKPWGYIGKILSQQKRNYRSNNLGIRLYTTYTKPKGLNKYNYSTLKNNCTLGNNIPLLKTAVLMRESPLNITNLNLCLVKARLYSDINPRYTNADTDKLTILQDNKNKSGIYLWTSLTTGKRYVGSSINLRRRFLEYYNTKYLILYKNMAICNALLKYGYSKFSLEILEYCDINVLFEREKHYFDVIKPEYNIAMTPGSPHQGTHSKEVRQKMSESRKGINHPFYGKKHNEEALTLMRIAALNRLCPAVPGLKVEVTDLVTKTTISYDSIRKAALAINSHIKTILRREKTQKEKGINTPYKNRYMIVIFRN